MPQKTFRMQYIRRQKGFSLVEVLIFLLVIMALVTILLSSAGVLSKFRGVYLDTIATRIASCEIEEMRKVAFSSLPVTGTINNPCNEDLAKLPQPRSAVRTVTDYLGDTKIKQVNIQVIWTEKSVQKDYTVDTLITEYGL